jgi:hypothetical protein
MRVVGSGSTSQPLYWGGSLDAKEAASIRRTRGRPHNSKHLRRWVWHCPGSLLDDKMGVHQCHDRASIHLVYRLYID